MTCYELDDWNSIPVKNNVILIFCVVSNNFGTHSLSVTGGSLLVEKMPNDSNYCPPCNAATVTLQDFISSF